MDEQQPLAINAERMKKLGQELRARFAANVAARSATENQWMKNVRQFIGEYDSSILAKLGANQSRAYPRITRVKVLSMVARLHALLFPAGEKNWSVEASPQPVLPADTLSQLVNDWLQQNPGAPATQDVMDKLVRAKATEIAREMTAIINDQLGDAVVYGAVDYQDLVREVMFNAVLYNCGVLKGPMTIGESGARIVVGDTGVPLIVEETLYRPYFEVVSNWDYYPDFSAKSFDCMDGQFQRHVYTRSALSSLADRDDFMGDAIRSYLREHADGNYRKMSYETELEALSDERQQGQPGEGKKFEVIEYWGTVSGHDLQGAGVEVAEADLAKDAQACVWMIDDVVIKVAASPFPAGTAVYHQFVFEQDEVNLMGSGLPAIMRDSQLMVSSFTRMLVDNASAVCGPNVEVDLEQLSPVTNPNTIHPFKTWLKDSPSSNGARAVQSITFNSHMTELLQAINLGRELADTETFVNPMTGGDFENAPSEALRTNGNMSMALASAALPFKDVVRNFDRFTKSVIHTQIHWNLVYHANRDRLRGDLRPIPRGASSLMAKEVRAVALDQLAATLSAEERVYINEKELLMERLQVRDLPLDRLLASDEEVAQRQQASADAAQRQQQQADALFDADLRTKQTEALKDITQAQKNADAGDSLVLRTLIDAIEKGANIDQLRRITAQTDGTAAQGAAAPRAGDSVVHFQPAGGGMQ
ncbi:hypothetical protein D3C86_960070 [compost metagenome]